MLRADRARDVRWPVGDGQGLLDLRRLSVHVGPMARRRWRRRDQDAEDRRSLQAHERTAGGEEGDRRRDAAAAKRGVARVHLLTLYYAPGTCALAPHIALVEAQARYETV